MTYGGIEMRQGETMCYYRARGGQKSVYVTLMYENDYLRESIIHKQESIEESYRQGIEELEVINYTMTY